MKDREHKRHYAHEAFLLLLMLALLLFVTRLWPILLLVILGIFIATLWLLFVSITKVEPVQPTAALPEPEAVPEVTEDRMQSMAYHLIQQRITQILEGKYPDVRWIWENPRAREDILAGKKVYVILNRAGGYRRGLVVIRNLQVFDVLFESNAETPDPQPTTQPREEPKTDLDEDIPEDYGLIAFQWVEAHVMELNEQINEAFGRREESLFIPAAKLPAKDSWEEICLELSRNDVTGACCMDDGILIEFEQ